MHVTGTVFEITSSIALPTRQISHAATIERLSNIFKHRRQDRFKQILLFSSSPPTLPYPCSQHTKPYTHPQNSSLCIQSLMRRPEGLTSTSHIPSPSFKDSWKEKTVHAYISSHYGPIPMCVKSGALKLFGYYYKWRIMNSITLKFLGTS